ncbi:hypothetical protein NPIL_204321, partial [Nephila pilipes]
MDSESLLDQDMISSASSSRASTPTHHEDFHVSCKRKREIERELKTYTDSIDHCQVLIRNLERQGLVNHPIYSNQCAMIQGLMKQRELLTASSPIPIPQGESPCLTRRKFAMEMEVLNIKIISQKSLLGNIQRYPQYEETQLFQIEQNELTILEAKRDQM